MGNVTFYYADARLSIPHKRELKAFIKLIFEKEKTPLKSLNYIFCSDEYLLKINRDFLTHDYYTDIISFSLGEGSAIEGEVYISIERVRHNAINLSFPFKEEILRVIFHGALHLCGYNDKKKKEISTMRSKEDHYIHLYKKVYE
jgi:rRNA maturation RNase YbeY